MRSRLPWGVVAACLSAGCEGATPTPSSAQASKATAPTARTAAPVLPTSTIADSRRTAITTAVERVAPTVVTVQTETAPYKYVAVEGPVSVEPIRRDDFEMASRYLGPELGRWYAENNPSTAESVVARLTPETWNTMDFAKLMG